MCSAKNLYFEKSVKEFSFCRVAALKPDILPKIEFFYIYDAIAVRIVLRTFSWQK